MKTLLSIFALLIASLPIFGQIKIAESKYYDGGSEAGELIKWLKQTPGSSGFIVIHTDKSRERLGNILIFISGVTSWVESAFGDTKKVSFAIVDGKKKSPFTEFWVIPKGEKKPKVKEIEIKLDNLKDKYLYADLCYECTYFSAAPSSDSFKPFAEALRKNPTYKGLIVVHDGIGKRATEMKNEMIEKFNLDSGRITIQIGKSYDIGHPVYDFYIIP